jgi:hypothetical protein
MVAARQVASPLREAMFPAAGEDIDWLWFNTTLADDDHAAVARWLERHPRVGLWARGTYAARVADDVGFLRWYPRLRRLDLEGFTDLAGLAQFESLRETLHELRLAAPRTPTTRGYSLKPITGLTAIEHLYVHGPIRDPELLAGFSRLTALTLRSVTLPSIDPLMGIGGLRQLEIKLGGTTDLRRLDRLERLKDLELWRIRGLRDLSVLGSLPSLQRLTLQAMGAINGLPSLRADRSLSVVVLEAMRGITDLRPVADAPALEELRLIAMTHLDAAALRPLVGHSRLRRAIWGLGSDRKNADAWDLLPLGPKPWNYDRVRGAAARTRIR